MKHKVLVPETTLTGVEIYQVKEVDDCFIDIPDKDIIEQLECLLNVKEDWIKDEILKLIDKIQNTSVMSNLLNNISTQNIEGEIVDMVNKNFWNLLLK